MQRDWSWSDHGSSKSFKHLLSLLHPFFFITQNHNWCYMHVKVISNNNKKKNRLRRRIINDLKRSKEVCESESWFFRIIFIIIMMGDILSNAFFFKKIKMHSSKHAKTGYQPWRPLDKVRIPQKISQFKMTTLYFIRHILVANLIKRQMSKRKLGESRSWWHKNPDGKLERPLQAIQCFFP